VFLSAVVVVVVVVVPMGSHVRREKVRELLSPWWSGTSARANVSLHHGRPPFMVVVRGEAISHSKIPSRGDIRAARGQSFTMNHHGSTIRKRTGTVRGGGGGEGYVSRFSAIFREKYGTFARFTTTTTTTTEKGTRP